MVTVMPGVVSGQTIRWLGPEATAAEAASVMAEHGIGAVVVLDGSQRLVGIVTEQDLVRRVIAAGQDPDRTPLSGIMTADPITVAPADAAAAALEKMRVNACRHVPVVAGGAVVGMLSMRDLRHSIARAQKAIETPHPLVRVWHRVTGAG